MVLQYIINWIIAFIFIKFQPKVNFAKKFANAIDPTRRLDKSLGFDLYTPVKIELQPGERKVVDTGIIFEFPFYLGMFVWDKSSVALGKCLSVCGGVVDPGYTGSVGVILQNCLSRKVTLPKGSAIAQVVFHLRIIPMLKAIDKTEISETERGERGFGGDWEWHVPKRPNDPVITSRGFDK